MKEREAFNIYENRLAIFQRDGWKCTFCGSHILSDGKTQQVAHLIPKTKPNLKKYGAEVIHHKFNLKTCCSLKCNSALNIGNKPILINKLVSRIQNELKG